MSTGSIRTFLAVDLSEEIRAALVALKEELARTRAAVRWVRDEGLHATVKFLGAIPVTALPVLQDALHEAVGALPRMRARVHGVGAFPSPARPRIVWVGVDCPPLARLAAVVDDAVALRGVARETRPFHPHVTLGRVTGAAGQARLRTALQAHADDVVGECELAALAAYRSDLRRGGALYTKLWTIPFGG